MAFALPRFYAIIERSIRPDWALEETARLLSGAGVRLIQLRDKQSTSQAVLEQARRLLSLFPAEARLVVNDRADVARLSGAAGVHLGQDDLPVDAARALLGPRALIGWSTHRAEQLEEGNALPADYLALGPIFATRTKSGAEPVVGLAALREARRRTAKPLVAIGGITPDNAAAVLEAGADSVAVISGWLGAADPGRALAAFSRELGGLE